MSGPICAKFGGDNVRSSLHHKFKNGDVKRKAFRLTSGCLITTIQFLQITINAINTTTRVKLLILPIVTRQIHYCDLLDTTRQR